MGNALVNGSADSREEVAIIWIVLLILSPNIYESNGLVCGVAI